MTAGEFREVDLDLLADYVGGALDGTPDEARVAQLVADGPGLGRGVRRAGRRRDRRSGGPDRLAEPCPEMPSAIADRSPAALAAAEPARRRARPTADAAAVDPDGDAGDAAGRRRRAGPVRRPTARRAGRARASTGRRPPPGAAGPAWRTVAAGHGRRCSPSRWALDRLSMRASDDSGATSATTGGQRARGAARAPTARPRPAGAGTAQRHRLRRAGARPPGPAAHAHRPPAGDRQRPATAGGRPRRRPSPPTVPDRWPG